MVELRDKYAVELLIRFSTGRAAPPNECAKELTNRAVVSGVEPVVNAANGEPLADVPGVPSDPDVITRDMLERIAKWKLERLREQVGSAQLVEVMADWNPSLHPRGPDGKFIKRPWNIDMPLDDIADTETHNLVEFLADTGGPPDMDSILSDDNIRIDGVPDDIDSVSELKSRMSSPTKDADVPSNPVEPGALESGDVIRANGEPFTVMDVGDGGVLQLKDKHGETTELDPNTDLSRNTVDRYHQFKVQDITDLPSVEGGDSTRLNALPQSTVTPQELEKGDYFISEDGSVLEFGEWYGNSPPDDPQPSDARVQSISGTTPLETEWGENVQRIDVDDKERVLGAMTMDDVPQLEQSPSVLKRGHVFTFPDMDPDDPENWYEVVRTSGRGDNMAITIRKNDAKATQTRRNADDMPDRITRAMLNPNAGLDDHPANVSARQEEFRDNNDLPGIDVPDTTGYLVNTKAEEKGVDPAEYEGQPRELAKALLDNTERDSMTKGAWEDVRPVLEDRIDQMKDDRLALQFAAHLDTLKKKSSPGGSVSRAGNPDDTTGHDTVFRISGSSSTVSLAAHEGEHAIIDASGGPASVNTAKANQYNSGREWSFSRELQGDTLKNMRDYFLTGGGLFGEANDDELDKPAGEALKFEEWSDRVENEVLGLSNVVDFRGRKEYDDPADYWRNVERGDALEVEEFGFDGDARAVVTGIEREADDSSAHKLTVRLKGGSDDTYKRGDRTLWLTTRGEVDPGRSDIDGATPKTVKKIKKGAVSDDELKQVEFGDGYAAEQLRQDFPDDDVDRLYEYIDALNESFYRQAVAKAELDSHDWKAYAIGPGYSGTNAHETAAELAGKIQSATKDDTSLVNTLATRHPRLLAAYAAQYDLPTGFSNAVRSFAFDLQNAEGDRDGTDELAEALLELVDANEVKP